LPVINHDNVVRLLWSPLFDFYDVFSVCDVAIHGIVERIRIDNENVATRASVDEGRLPEIVTVLPVDTPQY